MSRPIVPIELSAEQRESLHELVRRPTTPQRIAWRARIFLSCAAGLSQDHVARQQGVRRRIVSQWNQRFRRRGIEGLKAAKGRGRKARLSGDQQAPGIDAGTTTSRRLYAMRVRRMARTTGILLGRVHA